MLRFATVVVINRRLQASGTEEGAGDTPVARKSTLGSFIAIFENYARILYMTTLPIADARAQLSKLVEEARSTHERIEITKNGHRAAVLLGAADYDSMLETIAVLSDSALLSDHQRGLRALEDGDVLNLEELTSAMNDVGRRADAK